MAARGASGRHLAGEGKQVSEVLHVLMLMEARQVAVIMLLEMVVEEFVVDVEEVLLFSSTPNPRTPPSTRPAGRCLGFWG